MTSFGSRFKSLRKEKGYTQKELAEVFNKKYDKGFSESAISQYENNKRRPELNILESWAEFFDVSVDYLLCKTDNPKSNLVDLEVESYTPTTKLPILGSVRAGVGGFAYEEQIGYEEAYMSNCDPETHFYLKVKGDSMEPRIKEGDLALVKRQSDVECGELAIVLVNEEEGVIKKVIKKENSIELHSFNLYYPPRVFEGKEMQNVKIIGKVLRTMSIW